jgi:hypothetical protein
MNVQLDTIAFLQVIETDKMVMLWCEPVTGTDIRFMHDTFY